MKEKLKFSIKISEDKVLNTVKDEKLFFQEREEKIREDINNRSRNIMSSGIKKFSAVYTYGIDII